MAPPPGGRRTPLNVSYSWGQPGQLAGAQDQVREWMPVFQPDMGIFSPSYPLVPTDPERTRIWDFPVGYNYIYTPRSYEPVSFAELRALADTHDITRLAIETRKDQIEKLDWEIKPRDEKNPESSAEERADKLREFWERPDGERPFATWLRESLEDVLVIDAPAFEVRRQRDGKIIGLDVVDGSTIKCLIDITGRRPKPPAPAYEQVIHGRPWRLLTADEMIYAPRNIRPGHIYGNSPVQQIILSINTGIRRAVMQLQHFTESDVPMGLINAPDGWNAEQIRRFEEDWRAYLAGNTAERTMVKWVPWGAKFQNIKEPPFKDEFDEWLARIVMFCFSLPPDAFIRQRSRAAAQTAQQTALEEGLAPLMGWVKRLVDSVIQLRMGHTDLEFAWQEIRPQDPKDQSVILSKYAEDGIYTINEVRDDLGLDPVEGGDEPMFKTATGPVLLKDVIKQSEQAAAQPVDGGVPGAPVAPVEPGASNVVRLPQRPRAHAPSGAGALETRHPNPPGGGPKPNGAGQPPGTKPREVGKAAAGTFRAHPGPRRGADGEGRGATDADFWYLSARARAIRRLATGAQARA